MTTWYNPYAVTGQWYRGNTHLHTFHGPNDSIRTDSEIIINWYRAKGYHFLNFSDHTYITKPQYDYDDFIILSGHESDCIVAIDVDDRPDITDASGGKHLERLQFWIDDIISRGGIAQIAHPKATLLMNWQENLDYFMKLNGASLIELYNNRQGDYNGTIHWRDDGKYADQIWDKLLLAGKCIWPTAVDDSHDYLSRPSICDTERIERVWNAVDNQEEQFFESGGGWMCVLAEQLTPGHLKSAMRRGSIYASQGPVFKTIGLRDEQLVIETAETGIIKLILDGKCFSEHKTSALAIDLPSCKNHKYLRVEVINDLGKRAWSSPFLSIPKTERDT